MHFCLSKKSFSFILIMLVVTVCMPSAYAVSRTVTQYGYDASGNIVEDIKITFSNAASPTLTNTAAGAVRRAESVTVTLSGTGLANARIKPNSAKLSTTVKNSSDTSITVEVEAPLDAALGQQELVITTLLGDVSIFVDVYPKRPEILLSPFRLVVADNGTPLNIALRLSNTDVFSHDMAVSVRDTSVATVEQSTVRFDEGEIAASSLINLRGIQGGQTTLIIENDNLGRYEFTIFVQEPFAFPLGSSVSDSSELLGVVLDFNVPDLQALSPLVAQLGVVKIPAAPAEGSQSDPLQVDTKPLQLLFGSVALDITPLAVKTGVNTQLVTINGQGLRDIDAVRVLPSEGVSISNVTTEDDGTSVTFQLDVSAGALVGYRSVALFKNEVPVYFSQPAKSKLYVGTSVPVLDAIAPISVALLANENLVIRGQHIRDASAVNVYPPEGITLGKNIDYNADDQTMTVNIAVAETAVLGERVVTLTSPVGESSRTALSSNTINIVTGLEDNIDVSAALGVVKEFAGSRGEQNLLLVSQAYGVTKGAFFRSLSPAAINLGASINLNIQGTGLAGVDEVRIEPSTGLTLGSPSVINGGTAVLVSVNAAADAQASLRRVRLFKSGVEVVASNEEANQFSVNEPLVILRSIEPTVLLNNNVAQAVLIRGENLNINSQVSIEPADDITLGQLTLVAGTDYVRVPMTVANGAALGQRVIVVTNSGGSTSSTPSPQNTVQIASSIEERGPLLSGYLSVVRATAPVVVTQDRAVATSPLGINKIFNTSEIVDREAFTQSALSVLKGAYISSVSPRTMRLGETTTVTVTGRGLDEVTALRLTTDTGATLSDFTVNAAKTQLTVNVTMAVDAAIGARQLHLDTDDGRLSASDPMTTRLIAVADAPIISSMTPLLVVRDRQVELLIRGENFQQVTQVASNPTNGLSIGVPQINAEGTEIRVQLAVDRFANAGTRAIVLLSSAGDTTSTATAANTLTIAVE